MPELLPDPEPREVHYTIISVDDHLVEPPHLFEGRLPWRLADRAPRVVTTLKGDQQWEFEGVRYPQTGNNAVVGRTPDPASNEPVRFDEMRPGCWDVHARVRDMDINGVWASLNFPSMITGFAGRIYSAATDPELGQAVMRAWNDWLFEEWASVEPDRIIPLGITWLADPEVGAAEIRRNAARGFKSVSLPERPHRVGLPSIFADYWRPIIEACVDTGTVISVHVGSSGMMDLAPEAPPRTVGASLFGQLSLAACGDWLWSGYPGRYPDLKIALSEGGIGWVAMYLDRLDNMADRSGFGQVEAATRFGGLRASEVLQRNFWFCTLDDPSTIDTRHRIGVDHIMAEVDYPHGDSTWPDTQEILRTCWGHLPVEEIRKITHQNAAALYRHPLPPVCLP